MLKKKISVWNLKQKPLLLSPLSLEKCTREQIKIDKLISLGETSRNSEPLILICLIIL